jgi:hypothetical protein
MTEYTNMGKYYLSYSNYVTFNYDTLEQALVDCARLIGKWNKIKLNQWVAYNEAKTIAVIESKAKREREKIRWKFDDSD